MKSKDQQLLEEAYQSIYLKESTTLEDILPSLQWKQTTKQPKKYSYVNSTEEMPPMTYAVAQQEQQIVTHTLDGKETQNVAAANDVVMSGPS